MNSLEFGLYRNLNQQFHFIFSDFILSVLWPHKTIFTKMKTSKARLYNQEEHKPGGARITSLSARFISTPCTSSLLFMHKGEEPKLSKSQVSFHFKSLNRAQMQHVCTLQRKHTDASSQNTPRALSRTPSRSTSSSWCYTGWQSKGCNTSGGNADKMVSGPSWPQWGTLHKERGLQRDVRVTLSYFPVQMLLH